MANAYMVSIYYVFNKQAALVAGVACLFYGIK